MSLVYFVISRAQSNIRLPRLAIFDDDKLTTKKTFLLLKPLKYFYPAICNYLHICRFTHTSKYGLVYTFTNMSKFTLMCILL